MKFLSNAHTHTTYCDGKSTLTEMVAAAQKLGFVSLGLSGHADQDFDFPYCMGGGRQEKYLDEARRVQSELAERGEAPRLWVGLEQDAFVPEEWKKRNRAQTDYLIASTHYLPGPLDDQWVAVDGDPALLKRCVQERYHGDAVEMARVYFDTHASYVLAENAAIIGHFDLVRKYAPLIGLDTSCAAYQKAALDALERVRGGVLEINTGAIARGTATTAYPDRFLLDAWREMDGRITLTSDCHDAHYLDCAFAETLALLRSAGFERVLRLGAGDELWEEEIL